MLYTLFFTLFKIGAIEHDGFEIVVVYAFLAVSIAQQSQRQCASLPPAEAVAMEIAHATETCEQAYQGKREAAVVVAGGYKTAEIIDVVAPQRALGGKLAGGR